MEINDELLDHLSHLSRLEFQGTERESIRKDMQEDGIELDASSVACVEISIISFLGSTNQSIT